MGNPIHNLGDYNIVREALHAAGGSKEILYKSIGDTAVSKAAPKFLLKGGLVGAGVIALAWAGREISRFMKDRKRLVENEPALKKEFFESFETEPPISHNDALSDCDEISGKE